MKTTANSDDSLAEIWAIKDALSAKYGHSLEATYRALIAEQEKRPGDFVNLGAEDRRRQPPPPSAVAIATTEKIAA